MVPLSYNYRNLRVRWKTTLMTASGFTLVVAALLVPVSFLPDRAGELVWRLGNVAALLVAALWWIYNRTDIGLQARATMQNPAMARALGVDTRRIYMMTFTLGAALAGLSGALLAPTTSIMPFMGQQFVAPAFITVVVGGATNVIAGAVGSSLLLSLVKTPVGFFLGAFLGTVALLLAALIIIRLLPDGISAAIQRRLDLRHRMR